MEQKGITLTILGIVAIIAVVGLVLLFVNKPTVTRSGEAMLLEEEEKLDEEKKLSKEECNKKCTDMGYPPGYCYSGKYCPIGTFPAGTCNIRSSEYPYEWYNCCCSKKPVKSTSVAGDGGY